jgi:hypothetical protein
MPYEMWSDSNREEVGILKEVTAFFKVLSQNLPGKNEENNKKSHEYSQ